MSKVKDIKRIFEFSKIINHRKQIDQLVETPLVDICKYLYDINILTTMTSSNSEGINKEAYIIIDYDLLSGENKEIVESLLAEYPNNIKIGAFSTLHQHNELGIFLNIDKESDISSIQKFFWEIIKRFKMQDIHSFMDSDTFLKNVYTISDIVYFYLYCKREEGVYIKSEVIDEFLTSMGYIKVEATNFNAGENIYKGKCENFWIDNEIDKVFMPDYYVYTAIRKYRKVLFGGKTISKENINFDEILNFINMYSKSCYGEKFFFNSEDNRFYLNEELLAKHNRYVEHLKQEKSKEFSL